jgi:hypothetical protein
MAASPALSSIGASVPARTEGVSSASSRTGKISSCSASAGPPRSRASSETAAARPAPGAAAADREALAVEVELAGLLGDRAEREEAVLQAGGVRVLGRQPIVDADDRAPGLERVAHARRVLGVEVAGAERAAVEVDQRGRARELLAAIDAHGELTPVRGCERAIDDAQALGAGALGLAGELGHERPRRGHVLQLERRQGCGDGGDLWVHGAPVVSGETRLSQPTLRTRG